MLGWLMSDNPKTSAANRAFQTTQREELVKKEIAAERAKTDAKTAKLRALRLAKEAADKAAADAAPPAPPPAKKTKRTSKTAPVT